MTSDTPHEGEHRDPMDGAAAIAPVTGEMMDHAAREAAALADGVARHAVEPVAGTAEQAGDAAREAAAPVATMAAESTDAAERTVEAARDGTIAAADALAHYNAKLLDVMRANMAAASRHMAALVQAKSVPEAMSLNAEHLRQQFETMTAQSRELAVLAQRVAVDAMRPFKRAVDG